MKGQVLADPEVKALIEGSFVVAELYTDRKTAEDLANRVVWEKYGVVLPLYLALDPQGRELSRVEGLVTRRTFLDFLKRGLTSYQASARASR
jgi:hypothetical protein